MIPNVLPSGPVMLIALVCALVGAFTLGYLAVDGLIWVFEHLQWVDPDKAAQ